MIKGIIFDLDGTLIDTIYDIQNATNRTLDVYNLPHRSYEDIKNFLGNGSRVLIEKALPEGSKHLIDELLPIYTKDYEVNYAIDSKVYEGINELIEELNKRNIKIAVNSNKPDNITKNMIKTYFKDIPFIEVLGSRNNIPNKPDPTSVNEIINKMNLNKEEVLYVGDTEVDVKTGHNASLKVVGCIYGFRDEKTLVENKADYLINKPIELLNFI